MITVKMHNQSLNLHFHSTSGYKLINFIALFQPLLSYILFPNESLLKDHQYDEIMCPLFCAMLCNKTRRRVSHYSTFHTTMNIGEKFSCQAKSCFISLCHIARFYMVDFIFLSVPAFHFWITLMFHFSYF